MSEIEKLVDHYLQKGAMTESQHELLMALIHKDGIIDNHESAQLSRIVHAIQDGQLRIVDEGEKPTNGNRARSNSETREAYREHTENALARDIKQQEPTNEETVPSETSPEPSPNIHEQVEQEPPPTNPKKEKEIEKEEDGQYVLHESDNKYSLSSFLDHSKKRRKTGLAFDLATDRFLDINLKGRVWMKTGSMIAYTGSVKFTREGVLEHGLTRTMKKTFTGQGAILTKASGQGNVYLADGGKKISVLELGGNSIYVNGNSILAFEDSIKWDIRLLKRLAAMWAGGLFTVRLSGHGMVAITTHFDPVTMRVSPVEPVMTDASATVAWSGNLMPKFKTDIALKTLIGRTSGETLQLHFSGDGFVVVQPFEVYNSSESSEQ